MEIWPGQLISDQAINLWGECFGGKACIRCDLYIKLELWKFLSESKNIYCVCLLTCYVNTVWKLKNMQNYKVQQLCTKIRKLILN